MSGGDTWLAPCWWPSASPPALSTQLVSAAPAPEATPELLAQLSAEAGSAWAGRVAIADQYGEVRAEQARQAGSPPGRSDRHLQTQADMSFEARVARQAGSDRHLEVQADEALRARVARQAGSDRHLQMLADQAAAAQVERAAGSDRHLENLSQQVGGRITVR